MNPTVLPIILVVIGCSVVSFNARAVAAVPTVSIASTTTAVAVDSAFNLTCSIPDLASFDREKSEIDVNFAYSFERVNPSFKDIGYYRITLQDAVTYGPGTSTYVNAAQTADVDVKTGRFTVQVTPKLKGAAGVYRCSVQSNAKDSVEYVSTNQFRPSFAYSVNQAGAIPTASVKRDSVTSISGASNRYQVQCSAKVTPLLGYKIIYTAEGDYQKQLGIFTVNPDMISTSTSDGSVKWAPSNYKHPNLNLYPLPASSDGTVFKAVVETTKGIDYVHANVHCVLAITVASPETVQATFFSGNGSGGVVLSSAVVMLVLGARALFQ